MRVIIRPDHLAVAEAAATSILDSVAAQPDLVLGLPTGQTMIPLYAELAARRGEQAVDCSHVRGFNLDELLLPPGHPASFRRFMQVHAWDHTGLNPDRCEIPGTSGDALAECRRYDRAIAAAGGLDLAILGVGIDGHVAYNLPGTNHGSTHIVEVPRPVAESLGIPPDQLPLRAITVGMGSLRSARSVLLIATGSPKAAAIQALVDGPFDIEWPCSQLRDHPKLKVVTDDAAASLLHRKREEYLQS